MTRKLYDLDSHRRDFSATVLRCDPDGERYAVVLDQTVFFPEGGGQPADTGVLGGAHVLDVCRMADIVFMALHGENGENGKIQSFEI